MEFEMRKSLQQKQNSNIIIFRKCFIIYPEDNLKNLWDAISSIALLTTCFLTPFNLAFSNEVDMINWYLWLNYSIDIIFAIDIIVIFNSALQTDFEIIDQRCKLAELYVKGWFLIDLLSIFPFELMVLGDGDGGDVDAGTSAGENANSFVRMTRISKLYKLVKITKLIRIMKLFKVKNKKKMTSNMVTTVRHGHAFDRLSFFILILFLFMHFFGCLFIFVGRTF